MKVVDCPEGKFYVCVKMFGGGMGDQIRRYCESIPREVINPSGELPFISVLKNLRNFLAFIFKR